MFLNLANQITLLRIFCIPCFIVSMLYFEAGREYLRYMPVIIFSIAIISDALDGFIARVFDQKTKLGTWLDPIADKLLLISAFILLGSLSNDSPFKLPIWLVATVISRDLLIVLGSVIIHMIKGKLHVAPSYFGKITTFLQMFTIFASLVGFVSIRDFVWAATAFFTILSGLDYTLKGIKQL